MQEPKKIRTCIGCGKKSNKSDLLRLLRQPDGHVIFDRSGKGDGRGAYVCSRECYKTARETKRLSRALRIRLKEEELKRLNCEIGCL